MSLQSAHDLRNEGFALLVEEVDHEGALGKFNEAIAMDGDSAGCYGGRAECHLNLRKYKEALEDSTNAVRLSPNSYGAFYRLGKANFELGNYKAAQTAFVRAGELKSNANDLSLWLRKCLAEVEAEDDDVVMHQAAPVVEEKKTAAKPVASAPASSSSSSSSSTSSKANGAPKKHTGPVKAPSMKFIQKGPKVECAIYVKSSTDVEVNFTDTSFSVSLKLADGSPWDANIETFADIVPSECSFKANPYKVIVTLSKADKGEEWTALERASAMVDDESGVTRRGNLVTKPGEVASYPSSSKNKKDWGDIDKEVSEEMEKEKLEGDQALNKLFADLYAKGDEDTRRAMVKSMQTSGGTCLSMNWNEVQNTDYESDIQAPQGSVVNKYEQ